jgi:hypothetical protein
LEIEETEDFTSSCTWEKEGQGNYLLLIKGDVPEAVVEIK